LAARCFFTPESAMIGAHRPGDPADGSARMRILKKLFWYALALAFLVEAWLWDTSVAALHAIVDRLPLVRFKAACARGIERLPPLAVLPIFLLPVIVLLPFKLARSGCWRRALSWRADWLSSAPRSSASASPPSSSI
jgi:hypothetical protein